MWQPHSVTLQQAGHTNGNMLQDTAAAVVVCLTHCAVLCRAVLLHQSLSHPNIPQYIDYFEEDTATDRAFYIVQVSRAGCLCTGCCPWGCILSNCTSKLMAVELTGHCFWLHSLYNFTESGTVNAETEARHWLHRSGPHNTGRGLWAGACGQGSVGLRQLITPKTDPVFRPWLSPA
jgi:hypothetical protein